MFLAINLQPVASVPNLKWLAKCARGRARYAAHAEDRRLAAREWHARNISASTEQRRLFRLAHPGHDSWRVKAWKECNPERRILLNIKQRAVRRGLPFDLEPDDIEIPERCPVLGIVLKFNRRSDGESLDSSPSVDRLVPELGYVKGNIRIISNRANMIRSNATVAELQLVLAYAKSLEDL